MRVRTTWTIPKPRAAVWTLLCSSRMDDGRPCGAWLGVPKPVACRLPAGGGIGARRQCISERGMVDQRIAVWDEPRRLSFAMESTSLGFGRHVKAIVETFELAEIDATTTRATRTTEITLSSPCIPRAMMIAIGIKSVHRYVFRNWSRPVDPTSPFPSVS